MHMKHISRRKIQIFDILSISICEYLKSILLYIMHFDCHYDTILSDYCHALLRHKKEPI